MLSQWSTGTKALIIIGIVAVLALCVGGMGINFALVDAPSPEFTTGMLTMSSITVGLTVICLGAGGG